MKITPKLIVQLFIVFILTAFSPILISGRWDWIEAWIYALITVVGFVLSRGLAARRHPDLLAERARGLDHEDIESWDRVLSPVIGLGAALIPIAAGIDARFGSSGDFSLLARLGAIAMILAGYALATYAMMENGFFSGVVRIQTDRGHTVVSGGPYAWIRHPGYSGAVLSFLAIPILLDSIWALIAAFILTIALIIRTRLEDRTLQEKLPGYRDYANLVRYRLVPGIW